MFSFVAKFATFMENVTFPRNGNVEFFRDVAFLATFPNVTFYTTGPSSLIAAAVSFSAAEMKRRLCWVVLGVSGSKDGCDALSAKQESKKERERSYRKVGELWRRHKGPTDGRGRGRRREKLYCLAWRRVVLRPSVAPSR